MISGAGHHIFADKPEVFNDYVNAACRFSDSLPENDLRELFDKIEKEIDPPAALQLEPLTINVSHFFHSKF